MCDELRASEAVGTIFIVFRLDGRAIKVCFGCLYCHWNMRPSRDLFAWIDNCWSCYVLTVSWHRAHVAFGKIGKQHSSSFRFQTWRSWTPAAVFHAQQFIAVFASLVNKVSQQFWFCRQVAWQNVMLSVQKLSSGNGDSANTPRRSVLADRVQTKLGGTEVEKQSLTQLMTAGNKAASCTSKQIIRQ